MGLVIPVGDPGRLLFFAVSADRIDANQSMRALSIAIVLAYVQVSVAISRQADISSA